jgi:hypothetical protein
MSVFNTTALALCLALTAGTVMAQDATTKAAAADGAKAVVTLQECRDIASAKKDGMAKDEATMKKEAACSELLRKEDAAKSGATSTEPAKK